MQDLTRIPMAFSALALLMAAFGGFLGGLYVCSHQQLATSASSRLVTHQHEKRRNGSSEPVEPLDGPIHREAEPPWQTRTEPPDALAAIIQSHPTPSNISSGIEATGKSPDAAPPTLGTAGNASSATKTGMAELVLHFGPYKTSSSTLQQTIGAAKWTDLLMKDGWSVQFMKFFEGSYSHKRKHGHNAQLNAFWCNCFVPEGSTGLWYDKTVPFDYCAGIKDFLKKTKVGSRIFISSEYLSDGGSYHDLSLLASAFVRFKTTVVLVYRPYFDWLPSMYRQFSFDKWTYNDFMSNSRISTEAYKASGSYTLPTYLRYKAFFQRIRLRTAGDTLTAEVICDDMHAKQSCREIRALGNPTRYNVRASITKILPSECLDRERKELLWNVSLDVHRKLFETSDGLQEQFEQSAYTCFGGTANCSRGPCQER